MQQTNGRSIAIKPIISVCTLWRLHLDSTCLLEKKNKSAYFEQFDIFRRKKDHTHTHPIRFRKFPLNRGRANEVRRGIFCCCRCCPVIHELKNVCHIAIRSALSHRKYLFYLHICCVLFYVKNGTQCSKATKWFVDRWTGRQCVYEMAWMTKREQNSWTFFWSFVNSQVFVFCLPFHFISAKHIHFFRFLVYIFSLKWKNK